MAKNYDFVMDSDGDVLFSLNNPNAPFAVWRDSGVDKLKTAVDIPDHDPNDGTQTPTPSMTFLLSSRHLSLASPVLRTMLSSKWIEGAQDDSDGLYHVPSEDWDSEALATVMNIVHGRWSLVPRIVSFEMLAKIAVIVDYYDIREPLHLILSLWMETYTASSIPTSLCRDVVLWILVSWVFKKDVFFQQATKVAILRSTDDFHVPSDIPIPSSVIGE